MESNKSTSTARIHDTWLSKHEVRSTYLGIYEEHFAITKPTDDEKQSFWKNFTVVACEVYELEFFI
jgi:hypothetical protein